MSALGYLLIDPPLSAADHRESVSFDHLTSCFQGGALDLSRLSLGRDPSEWGVGAVMKRLAAQGYALYLNAVWIDEELGYNEWLGYGADVSATRPAAPLEEVRSWMGDLPPGAPSLDAVLAATFQLLRALEALRAQEAPDVDAARRLSALFSEPALARAVFHDCHAMTLNDLCMGEPHDDAWRVQLGAYAALLLRVVLDPELRVPTSDLEAYLAMPAHSAQVLPDSPELLAMTARLRALSAALGRSALDRRVEEALRAV